MVTIDTSVYGVSTPVLTLAQCIYYTQAEAFGTLASVAFNKMTPRDRAPFVETAARVLASFSPRPRARVRIATPRKSTPKPPRFEIWSLSRRHTDSVFVGERRSITDALALIPQRKHPLRVRTFYDQHRKCRIVQFLCGNGLAVRNA